MNEQHAPGPWIAKPLNLKPLKEDGSMWSVTSEGGRVHICGIYGVRDVKKGEYDKETAATAQLIASAPDLLRALSDLVFLCESELEKKNMGENISPNWFSILQEANTAIERATIPNRP